MAKKVTLTAALESAVSGIRIEFARIDVSRITDLYRLGKRILELHLNADGKYGSAPLDYLYSQLGRKRDTVRSLMSLASRFTEKQIEALLTIRHPTTSDGLMWSSLAVLARLKDWTVIVDLAHRAVSQGWNAKEINWHVIRASGKRSNGGRRPKRFGTFEEAVDDVTRKSTAFVNAAAHAWLPDETGLAALRAAEIGTSVPPGRDPRTAVEDAVRSVEGLVESSRTVLSVLRKLLVLTPEPALPAS